jgi:flagellar biosynthesis/type III secretory pathway protein FliH
MEDAKEEARKTGLAEGRAEGRAEGKAEGKAEGRAEGKAEGRAEGQTQANLSAVQKVLFKRLKLPPESVASQLSALKANKLEALFEAALDFETPADLENWLKTNG